jgi:lipoprotein-anchoring transpeptidase ErfK/SrfK
MTDDRADNHKTNADRSSPRRRPLARAGKWIAVALGVLTILCGLGAVGVAYATLDYAEHYEGRILPGTVVAGVEVGGLTRRQATKVVRASVQPELRRRIRVRYGGRKWVVTPKRLGASTNAAEVVRSAFAASAATTFLEKMRMRMFGEESSFERSVEITYPRRGVRGFVEGLASTLYVAPRDARLDYSTGWVKIQRDRTGRRVEVAKARRALSRALHDSVSKVRLPVKTLRPDVTSEAFAEVLLVRIGENRLYLYENGKITHSWSIATGQPEYPTPTGLYEITEKRYMPTWINPAPKTWGADLPVQIPPGPGNPLGVRALNWSAPAIRFHGTEATYSLGYNASHGCVRLSNADVVQLYDLVDVGTPIVSVVAAELKPMYVSSPDPTPVAEDAPGEKQRSGDGNRGSN